MSAHSFDVAAILVANRNRQNRRILRQGPRLRVLASQTCGHRWPKGSTPSHWKHRVRTRQWKMTLQRCSGELRLHEISRVSAMRRTRPVRRRLGPSLHSRDTIPMIWYSCDLRWSAKKPTLARILLIIQMAATFRHLQLVPRCIVAGACQSCRHRARPISQPTTSLPRRIPHLYHLRTTRTGGQPPPGTRAPQACQSPQHVVRGSSMQGEMHHKSNSYTVIESKRRGSQSPWKYLGAVQNTAFSFLFSFWYWSSWSDSKWRRNPRALYWNASPGPRGC
jgi:hypothetical protein